MRNSETIEELSKQNLERMSQVEQNYAKELSKLTNDFNKKHVEY